MTLQTVSLHDRYDLGKQRVLLSGVQALTRLPLMQRARDQIAGLNTAGYVTGYRGSPLGSVDMQMAAAARELTASQVRFQTGLNEDLAATALWGTQQAHLRGEGKYDGVFGLWYGKGPGVDRSCDVFRHANFAGTAPHGGVIAAMGDDHTGESSTTLHQSEFAFVDVGFPILSPAGVQEVLDYGIYGWALSRYCGCWVGLKCVKDTIEVSQVVDANPHRVTIAPPEGFEMPEGGLNIRLGDNPTAQEARLHDHKHAAARAFARANRLDRRVHGGPGSRIGIVSSGKSWLDTVHALKLLGIDSAEALGITTYKVGMVWPMDLASFRDWAEGLDLIVVVEEKRKLIEPQIKEDLFNRGGRRRVIGWLDEAGKELFNVKGALDPVTVARGLGRVLFAAGCNAETLGPALERLDAAAVAANQPEVATRTPYFCAGCPHNGSTRLPEGARAYAGIGCHYLAQFMDRNTEGFTHMGGEGANWIGESRFSTRRHVFQNIGDGTYTHSGVMAIRAALAAGDVNITFKILYNDAVAMTGGQAIDNAPPERIAEELLAMGVRRLVVVHDPKEGLDPSKFPRSADLRDRDQLIAVERELQDTEGVTVILYVQTCAAEKRRRRRRGTYPDPDRRVFIHPDICEGCGDCGRASNCVAILPLDTEFGRKRQVDQSACNKDFSCLEGFCPSFVSVTGAEIRKEPAAALDLPHLPQPELPAINGTYNVLVTGIGGTGVVTIGALLAMASHIEGKGAAVMEMAGLAQKGGSVQIHLRIADQPADIDAVRLSLAEADAVLGGDLVVTAGAKVLALLARDRSRVLCNAHQVMTGAFTRDPGFRLPVEAMHLALARQLGEQALTMLDATALATRYLGDAIFANMVLVGAAWQAGMLPLSWAALEQAIGLNGVDTERNLRAFQIGRWAQVHPQAAQAAPQATPGSPIDTRAAHLQRYGGKRLVRRYRALVQAARTADADLGAAVAQGYHRLLAAKDEYEVARLHVQHLQEHLDATFARTGALRFHLAPPILARRDAEGRPRKTSFGPWILPVLRVLARLRFLRGTPFDPFRNLADRKLEKALVVEYEADMRKVISGLNAENSAAALELADLPSQILGFGPVKARNAATAARRRAELIAEFDRDGDTSRAVAAE